ncbi:hypothetical protein [Streptomyces sp. NPDC056938]|uniref:hypothetical protein n=1 Tax=unclassified Streptomyces TaxID=2593676 RepID=UPI00363DF631
MTRLISELSLSGLPVWLIATVLLIAVLTVLVKALADARATVVRAHGESDRTVAVLRSRLSHQRWKRQRRDRQCGRCSGRGWIKMRRR